MDPEVRFARALQKIENMRNSSFRKRKNSKAYGHICSASGAPRFGLGILEPSRDAKVAEFHVASFVQEDVGRFDVAVDDAVLLLEVVQCFDRLRRQEMNN